VRLEYLLLYLPDYNPIKKSFKVLKSWLKRHAADGDVFTKFGSFLEYAVQRACCDIDCRSWFDMCGY
jgi:transposase